MSSIEQEECQANLAREPADNRTLIARGGRVGRLPVRRGLQGGHDALSHHERAGYAGPLTLSGLRGLDNSLIGEGSAIRGNPQQGSIRSPVDGLQGRLDVGWRLHEPPLAGPVPARLPVNARPTERSIHIEGVRPEHRPSSAALPINMPQRQPRTVHASMQSHARQHSG
jgi:hypothetical protein